MSAIDELAAFFGIEERFTDARGDERITPLQTKRLLLAALGADAHDDAAAHADLRQRLDVERRRALPAALVIREGERAVITCGADAPRPLQWRLTLEDGSERSASSEGEQLAFDALPPGYHRLALDGVAADALLIVTPGACILPAALRDVPAWGLAVQLYLLRSAGNWGIGDFSDLRHLVELIATRGGDVIGLNPLHALFLDEPEHASPYAPASRLLLNALNIDVTAVPEFAGSAAARGAVDSPAFQAELERARNAPFVRYADIAHCKLTALRLLFDERARAGPRADAFAAFVRAGGERLRNGCIFQALRQSFAVERHADWHDWPLEFQDPASPAVAAFASEHAVEIDFFGWLQFIADEQLALAAGAARAGGMRVGLYRDLAVGADPAGAEVWSDRVASVATAAVGAPPDIYNPQGQNWGLPPFHPLALRERQYRPFIDLVRANMRHSGAIRIDHVMALQHLYLIPAGSSAADGAFVSYPLDDLLGILALESVRENCLVIGEDLGTVPAGFRERIAAANVLSYRVLYFETDPESRAFAAPQAYPEKALAVVASHDLPTLRAWLGAADLDLKERLQLLDEHAARVLREQRFTERTALVTALHAERLLPADTDHTDERLIAAVHAYLARSRAILTLAQLDDITQEAEPVNVPTTTDEYPNWRRRISLPLEQLDTDPVFAAIAETFAHEGRGNVRAAAR